MKYKLYGNDVNSLKDKSKKSYLILYVSSKSFILFKGIKTKFLNNIKKIIVWNVYVYLPELKNLIDNLTYTSNGLIPPSINDRGFSGAFKKDYRYQVQGRFGWSSVPDNVEEACIILIQQFFDKDKEWRNRYVKSVSSFDMRFEFMEDAHRGTGNLYADQLLQPYVITGMVVI